MGGRLRIICFLVPLTVLFSFRLQALELNGVAPFTELGNEIYLAGLFVDARSDDPAELFSEARERKMEIRFSSDMSRRRWTNNWMQSIAINTSRDALVEAADDLSAALTAFAGSLATGDQVEIHYQPGQGTAIRLNGTTLASDLNPGIFNLFLSSWIGPVPPSSNFRNALLGRENSTVEQDRFYFIEPTADRVATVTDWVEDGAEAEAEAEAVAATESEVAEPEVVKEVVEEAAEEAAPEALAEAPSTEESVAEEVAAEDVVEEPAAAEPQVVAEPEPVLEPEPEPMTAAVEDDEGELDVSVAAILAQQEYAVGLIRKIYSNVQYPAPAVRRNQEGSVRVRLTLAPDGSVASIAMLEEAPHGSLNREAERAIRAAAPFEALPQSLQNSAFEIEVPIAFRLTSED